MLPVPVLYHIMHTVFFEYIYYFQVGWLVAWSVRYWSGIIVCHLLFLYISQLPSLSPSSSSVDIISWYPLNLFCGGWLIQIKCHSYKNQDQPYHCYYNSRNKLNGTRGCVFFLLLLFFLMMLLLLEILPYDFYCCYWWWWWQNIRTWFCFLPHVFAATIAAAAAAVFCCCCIIPDINNPVSVYRNCSSFCSFLYT